MNFSEVMRNLRDKLWFWWYFPPQDLDMIEDAVKRAEAKTTGEIRVVIRLRLDPDCMDVQSQALREFAKHGLQNTRDRTGVLILIVLEEHQFFIMCDEGINQKLPENFLGAQAYQLSLAFIHGEHYKGLLRLIRVVGDELSVYFPAREGNNPDELRNRPVVEV